MLEDDEGVLAGDAVADFLQIVPRLAARDPALKSKDVRFFGALERDVSDDSEDAMTGSDQGAGTLTYRDMQREHVLRVMKGQSGGDEESSGGEGTKRGGLTVAEEEAEVRHAFLAAAESAGEDDGDVVLKKPRTAEEEERERNECANLRLCL